MVRQVTLKVAPVPDVEQAGIVFIGMQPENVLGNWSKEGVRPAHHLVVPPTALSAEVQVAPSLHGDLMYFALLDLDGDTLPSPGEPVGGPVPIDKDTEVAAPPILIDRVWGVGGGDAEEPDAAAPEVAGLRRTLRIDTQIRPPFLKTGRVLVIGMPESKPGTYQGPLVRQPVFRWASENLALDWPITVEAEVPEGGDVVVLLDLDGGSQPTLGDLASEPLLGFVPPGEGEQLSVALTGPLTEEGEGGDSGDGEDE